MIDPIVSAFVQILGGRGAVLTLFSLPFVYIIGFVFYKISGYGH